ncbi:MAG: hypothetical protein GWN53_17350 [Gammaproteobacteria bacterium]|uniref:Uncharacterized protein n=1 Tax=Candidatus Kutchimonas denitrificans TaxID=3056748 RepID=A0AAE4ZD80_9BACT|nr:hypothetical protein [Candidatus Kutchimonas denitrificans]NIV53609.1 hypothetical protein [Gammaproteobacteria bacterium]
MGKHFRFQRTSEDAGDGGTVIVRRAPPPPVWWCNFCGQKNTNDGINCMFCNKIGRWDEPENEAGRP